MNVLLLVVDSMRADMPWAGYPRDIAPNLTALEKQSVSYTRAYAISSYTAKAVAGFLSGQYPSSLKRDGVFFTEYPKSNLFFPEVLQRAGVYTTSAQAHGYMRKDNGMQQGFDRWQVVPGIRFDATTDLNVTGDRTTALSIEQLSALPKDRRFFAYVHYMDPHEAYRSHPESPKFGHAARDLYDEEIFYTDLWLGKLLEFCKQQSWWGDTAVIVMGDHGEAFGEHGAFRHAFELWEPLVRVPLFFVIPGVAPRRIDTPRSEIDLAPTVLALTGVSEAPAEFRGKSLVPELYGAEAEERPVLLDLPADSNNFERRGFILGRYKVLAFEKDWRVDVYDVVADPEEKQNLKRKDPEKYAEMVRRYKAAWAAVPQVRPYGGNKLKGGGYADGPRE
jgi:choline-sulfatase